MGVGNTMTSSQIDNLLTSLTIELRDLAQEITRLNLQMTTSGGTTWLTAIGYGTAANPANPGSISDTTYASNLTTDMNVLAQLYYGLATLTPAHNYDAEFSVLWAGQTK